MKMRKFTAEVQAGHKENAVEVPFDPTKAWGLPPEPLWRGRRGHVVQGNLNGRPFESFIVPRSKKFFCAHRSGTTASSGSSRWRLSAPDLRTQSRAQTELSEIDSQ